MKIKLAHPLVSCICITHKRPSMLLKAVFSFLTQNYPNRELVISYPKKDLATKDIISKIREVSDVQIISLERDEKDSLGNARNHAVANCNGEYICTWDDDDIYHYDRILHQFNDMQGKYIEAGILSCVFMYDTMTQKAFHSAPYNWGGTLICRKDLVLKYPYLDADTAEDMHLIKSLESRELLHKITDSAYLYTFIYHQNNALDYFYFQHFLYNSQLLNEESRDYLRKEYETQYAIRES